MGYYGNFSNFDKVGHNEKKENIFAGFHPEKYVAYFAKEQPDILCMAECLLDNENGQSFFVADISERCGLPYYKNLVGEKAFFVDGKYYGKNGNVVSKKTYEKECTHQPEKHFRVFP